MFDRDRQAHLSSTSRAGARPSCSASASAIPVALCRRGTRSSTSSPRTPSRSCRLQTASGWRSKSGGTPTSRRFRIPDARWNWARREGYPGRANLARRREQPALVWRQPAGVWTLGPELFTRDLARTFTFLDAPREAGRARGEGRADRVHRQVATCRTARSHSSARGSSRWPTPPAPGTPSAGVIENGTVVVEGNRITAIGRTASVTSPPARSGSTSPARRSCRG